MKKVSWTYGFSIFFSLIITFSCKKTAEYNTTPGTQPPSPPPAVKALKPPKVSTVPISNLTVYSVILGGFIIDTGISKVTEQGIVVGLTPGATVSSNFKKFAMEANTKGEFSRTIINMPANTTFYVRAYGINSDTTGYGNEISFTSLAEKVFTGWSATLTTQKEVNEFGANNYTTILNGLEIKGTGITDLSPLKSLVILGGGLWVQHTSLTNFRGLDNLEIIGNNFYNTSSIEDNNQLTSLTGLNNVKMINGPFQLVRNNALESCEGLNNLTQMIGGGLGIYDCNSLRNLNGLERLLFMDGTLWIQRNPSLNNVRALGSLTTITEDIRIGGNSSLTSLDGLEKLTKLRTLDLESNAVITNINGLRNLISLNGLLLDNNALINDLSALKNITTSEFVDILRNNSLTDLTGLSNIEAITGKLTINSNPRLIDLVGLEKLKAGRSIEVAFNNSLVSLNGLNNLKGLNGSSYSLTISQNPSLTSLQGLENLVDAEGQVYIGFNKSLIDFCPIKPLLLKYVRNSFVVEGNGITTDKNKIISMCP
jgi:hypothetical protein